jgi:hypothetical protein
MPTTPVPSSLSDRQRSILELLLNLIAQIPGVAAIVIGGSHARGTARSDSDIDVGLYYHAANPFPIDQLVSAAGTIATTQPVVTGFYDWGPWVNGGAWIQTEAGKIDLLYRSLDQVVKTIDEAQRGIYYHNYLQQPSFGFSSIIYLAETQCCLPLIDQAANLTELKKRVAAYPPELRHRLIRDSLTTAEFTLVHARDFGSRGDRFNTVGCIARAAYFLIHTFFAVNETYYFGDKGCIEALQSFPILAADLAHRIEAALAPTENDAQVLSQRVADLIELFRETVDLVRGDYTPKFGL